MSDQQEINNNNNNKLTRREFLKVAGATGAGVVLGGSLYYFLNHPAAQFAREIVSPHQELFEQLGLGHFYPFYRTALELHSTYGTPLPYCDYVDMGTDFDPYHLLFSLDLTSRLENDKLQRIGDNWGIHANRVSEHAREKVAKLDIKFATAGINVNTEVVREAYRTYANVFPFEVVNAADVLYVTVDTSSYNGGRVQRGVQHEPPLMWLISPQSDRERFFVQAMHEHSHAGQSKWDINKPYIEMGKYAEFLRLRTQVIKEVLDKYFALNWQDARGFKSGSLLVEHGEFPNQQTIVDMENYLSQNASDASFPPDPQTTDGIYRFNRLGHMIGQCLLRARLNAGEIHKRGGWVPDLLGNDKIREIVRRIIFEFDHYLDGPVQKPGGGFPSGVEEVADHNGPISNANLEIQLARLKTFSALSADELINTDSSLRALQQHFDLHG